MALPKNRRLTNSFFKEFLKKGKPFHSPFFLVRTCFYPGGRSRFAFVVSTKVEKSAVKRNKLKRRLSEIVFLHLGEIKDSLLVAVFAKPMAKDLSFKKLEKELLCAFNKANVVK
jgi:ribonuclease P protein component